MGDETNRVGLIPSKNLEENRKAFVRSDMDYSKSSLCEYILKHLAFTKIGTFCKPRITDKLIVFPPVSKKGMVRLLKKGTILRATTCQKGTLLLKRATASKRALLSGPCHSSRAHLCTVIINTYYIFSVISNLLFSLNCSFLNFHISGFTFINDNLINFYSLCLTLL